MIVYLLLNTINNKSYVGKHKGNSIETRWDRCLDGANNHLKAAKNKYGVDVFSREILNYCSSEEEMNNLERLWILTLRTYDPNFGYNMTYGSEGKIHTSETKMKMSKVRKGRKLHPNTRKAQLASVIGSTWITNGVENKHLKKDSTIPVGWFAGQSETMRRKVGEYFKRTIWINNGLSCRRILVTAEIPKGWNQGMGNRVTRCKWRNLKSLSN